VQRAARAALVRRNTKFLIGAQAVLLAVGGIYFTLAVVAVVDLSGHERWGGVMIAIFNVSAAASALSVGRLMDRIGRKPGLAAGHVLFGLGGVAGGVAVAAGSAWGLLGAAVLFGAGMGAGLLGRVAVADMYPSEQRGRVVGLLVAGGTIGAVGGPPLVAAIERLAGSDVAPWFSIPALELAGVALVLALRPDPRDLAVASRSPDAPGEERPASPARPLRELLRVPPLRAAIVTIGVAQASMVAVMGVAPIVIDQRGGSSLAVALVLSVHMAGMYAIAPVVGTLLDRFGRRPGLLAGGAVSAAGALLGSFSHATPLVGVGLFLVGLGWAACYLGATAAISDLTEARERGGALGFTDLFTSLASASGALAGGFVLESSGIAVVGAAMAAIMVPTLLLVLPLREPAPGRWRLAVADEPA
jgi:MFS family permease